MLPFLFAAPRPEPPPALPACPRCGGPLVPLPGQRRCQRCCFALCEECDAIPADDDDAYSR
jgi:hypothetical protein